MKFKSKVFAGALGGGLPVNEFEEFIEKPDHVKDNLERLRPMVTAVRITAETEGWTKYILPFIEKRADTSQLLLLIREKKDVSHVAAKIEAYTELKNYINSLVRSADSLASLDAAKAERGGGDAL